jgi:hypothetical protein
MQHFDEVAFMRDAQVAMAFLEPQFYNIEAAVAELVYPSFVYEDVIPVITEGDPWADGVMFYSGLDIAGRAEFLADKGFDIPMADVNRGMFLHSFHLAGIGYEWSLAEIARQARAGRNLPVEKAAAAKEIAQRFLWGVAFTGATERNLPGAINHASVPTATVAANGNENGGTNSTYWTHKTGTQIQDEINAMITGIYGTTESTVVPDTVLLPTTAWQSLAVRRSTENSDLTILEWLRRNNVFTAETGRPLVIRGNRALNAAGAGGEGRVMVYRRDPQVIRFHLPMPHMFLPPFQVKSTLWEVAGLMRTGGTEIRRPKEIAYYDGVTPAP